MGMDRFMWRRIENEDWATEKVVVNDVVWDVMRPTRVEDAADNAVAVTIDRAGTIGGRGYVCRASTYGEQLVTYSNDVFAYTVQSGVSERVLSECVYDPKDALRELGMSDMQMWAWASRFRFDLSPKKEIIKDRTPLHYASYHYGSHWNRRQEHDRLSKSMEWPQMEAWIQGFMNKYSTSTYPYEDEDEELLKKL